MGYLRKKEVDDELGRRANRFSRRRLGAASLAKREEALANVRTSVRLKGVSRMRR